MNAEGSDSRPRELNPKRERTVWPSALSLALQWGHVLDDHCPYSIFPQGMCQVLCGYQVHRCGGEGRAEGILGGLTLPRYILTHLLLCL